MREVLQFPSRIQQVETESVDYLPIAVGAGFIAKTKTFELTLCPPILDDEPTDCPEITNNPLEFAPRFIVINPENTPWLRGVRQEALKEGKELHASRHKDLIDGKFDSMVLDVDALGTAEKIDKIRKIHGEDSEEYKEGRRGLVLDCARKWAEAFRINKWEYFEEIVQHYVAELDKVFANGLPVDDMLKNGISPVAVPEELRLRLNDLVSFATSKELLRTPSKEPIATIRITPCPEWAHESLKNNPKSAHGGNAPQIDKFMLHFDTIDTENSNLYHEQLGVSGDYITPEVMQEVLTDIGAIKHRPPMSRAEIHAVIAVLQGENLPNITDFMDLLDKKASEKSGKNIFLGEVVTEDHPKDYQIIYTEAEMRRLQQADLAEELACYVENLQAKGVDHAIATQMVEKYMQDRLLDIVEKNPSLAETIFDKPTAKRFHKAQELKAQGRTDEAAQMIDYARMNAPDVGSCGGGSCGLELGANLSPQVLSKLQAEAGDTVLIDTERPCNSCGNKTVVYAFNASKVNKYCTSCDAFESTQTGTGKTQTNKGKDHSKVLTQESDLKESKPDFKGGLLELFGVQSIDAPKQEHKLVGVGS
ncbi:MAG: hypothetical protein JWO47_911 [Candidatus Saccharibacteria bacterium]|nr:hypothetical protein [Candidatus Saccharibacteria bacterium]